MFKSVLDNSTDDLTYSIRAIQSPSRWHAYSLGSQHLVRAVVRVYMLYSVSARVAW